MYFFVGEYYICKAGGQGKKFGSEDGVIVDCVFPFIYGGKKYDGCVPSSKDGKGPWCATKVDSRGIMRKDKWARCNKPCPKDDGILQLFEHLLYKIQYCIMYIYIYHSDFFNIRNNAINLNYR